MLGRSAQKTKNPTKIPHNRNAVNQECQSKKNQDSSEPPKLSSKPSRLEGRVLKTEYPECVSGLLRDCKYPVNSVASLDGEGSHGS